MTPNPEGLIALKGTSRDLGPARQLGAALKSRAWTIDSSVPSGTSTTDTIVLAASSPDDHVHLTVDFAQSVAISIDESC